MWENLFIIVTQCATQKKLKDLTITTLAFGSRPRQGLMKL